ncbi:UNVERIFIED_CONTAM: hypothetical protein Slati_0367200 [Sesamum latifolium]|uniref:Fungal lipase-type domain-containing protein n=1 Tax=Sesamum latifolium TaxID=2727402 RepID=A0AAW2YGD4_9LAMI
MSCYESHLGSAWRVWDESHWVLLKKDYVGTQGKVSPYMIYLDHDNADIVVAIRGLNLGKESDFLLLLDNKLGQTTYDGGYVHNGLLKAAQYVLQEECEILRELVERNPDYTLTFGFPWSWSCDAVNDVGSQE